MTSQPALLRDLATRLVALAALSLPSIAGAATFNVASGDVAGLIAAIQAANANDEADTIVLAAGTYSLTSGPFSGAALPTIASEIRIVGAGAATTRIERSVAASFDLMRVVSVAALELEGVTLHDGDDAISNSGRLEIRNAVLSDNHRAIDMTYGGRLRVVDTLIQGNGTGIYGSTGFPTSSLFIEIVASTIDGNDGAGLTINNHYSSPATRVVVTDSTISNNGGGGIVSWYSNERELVVRRSTISGNSTTGNGGGISLEGASVAPGGLVAVTIDSSTISGNSARLSGGGIHLSEGLRLGRRIQIRRSTITGNVADSDANGSGNGGGISTPSAVVDLEDSIVAGNTDTGGQVPDCDGPLTSRGHNLLGSTQGCFTTLASSDVVAAPLLGPLAANGGPTATHLPLPGSPALDAADPKRCGAPDQRGLARPADGDGDTVAACDVGAAEAGATTPVTYLSDPFLCYDVKVAAPALPAVSGVTLVDDLEGKSFDVKKTKALCTPADLNGERAADQDTHLHARDVKESKGEPRHLRSFGLRLVTELGMFQVDTLKPDRLLVPTAKGVGAPLPAPDPLSHDVDRFKCYKARLSSGTPALPRGATAPTVMLANQFTESALFTLVKLQRVCDAANMNGLGTKNPGAWLACFKARAKLPLLDGSKEPTFSGLFSTSDFGTEQLATKRAYEVCLPAVLQP